MAKRKEITVELSIAVRQPSTTLVRLAVRNTGDLTVNVLPGLQSALGINGLTPSAITSPQTLFSTILPIGIACPSYFAPNYPGSPSGEVQANSNAEFDVSVFPTHYVAGTVELMNVNLVVERNNRRIYSHNYMIVTEVMFRKNCIKISLPISTEFNRF